MSSASLSIFCLLLSISLSLSTWHRPRETFLAFSTFCMDEHLFFNASVADLWNLGMGAESSSQTQSYKLFSLSNQIVSKDQGL